VSHTFLLGVRAQRDAEAEAVPEEVPVVQLDEEVEEVPVINLDEG